MEPDKISKIINGPVFDDAYKNYRDECEGMAMMVPSTDFGPGGVEEAHKRIVKHMIQFVLETV